MKKEQVLELLKKAAGENEIDLDKLDVDAVTEEWNNSINGAIKAETERAKEKTEEDMLSRLGYENEDAIKEAIQSTKTDKEKENERIETLTKEVETLKSDISTKDNVLLESNQKELLKKSGIREDRVNQAYKLIKDDVTEETDFDTAVKDFIEKTPEWNSDSDKRKINHDSKHEGGEDDKKEDSKVLEEAWG